VKAGRGKEAKRQRGKEAEKRKEKREKEQKCILASNKIALVLSTILHTQVPLTLQHYRSNTHKRCTEEQPYTKPTCR
jgi:hypothetical protein